MPLSHIIGVAMLGAIVYMALWKTENQDVHQKSKCIDPLLLSLSAILVTAIVEGATILYAMIQAFFF